MLDVNSTAFVDEARIARDDEQLPETRESRYYLFHDPIGKVFLFAITTQVLEGQNGN